MEADINGNITAETVWGHQPLARKVNNAWYYYIYNAHGDVIGLVSDGGEVVNSYEYDAWGNIVALLKAEKKSCGRCTLKLHEFRHERRAGSGGYS